MNKYILVTGGAGYIGSHISYLLNDKGYKVIILDNLSTGFKKLIDKRSIFINADINNKKQLNKIFNKYCIYAIYHFAACVSVPESQKKISKYFNTNVLGTKNLLENVIRKKIQFFIFSSTCSVYGTPKKNIVLEKDPKLPESNYGITKLLAEQLIINYINKYKLKYSILRYFNVIGSDYKLRTGQLYSGPLLKNIVQNIINKNYKISVHGNDYSTRDGTCIRDYIDINDLSNIHYLALKKLEKSKSFIINCGYNQGYTVLEIIKYFEKIIKKKINISYKKRRPGDVEQIFSDNSNLKKIFPNWKRRFSIRQSIINLLKWEKKNKN